MSEPDLTAAIRASDDQATAEARQDAIAVARFWRELVSAAGMPDDLAADCTRIWLDGCLDTGEV